MAPVTSDLVQIARKSIKTSPVMQHHHHEQQQQQAAVAMQQPQQQLQTPVIVKEEPKETDLKSVVTTTTPPTSTIKLPEKMIKQAVSTDELLSLQQKSNKIPLKFVNAHITCSICKGYLIDATTLVECLHSFCHSCIMKHLRIQDYCPKCDVLVNKAKLNIKPDTTLQAIVYKLVPELYEKELLRRRAFYKMCPKEAALATPDQRGDDTENLIFSPKEALSLSLEFADIEDLPKKSELKKPIYLQCPAIFQVSHLKKFVLSKFGIDGNLLSVELMYKVKTIVLPDHYTLMDIAYIYTWKRDAPMRFYFRVIKNLQPLTKTEKPMEEAKAKIKQESDIKCETNNNSVDNVINKNEKHESIKLKIELSKQGNMVSILKSGSQSENNQSDKKESKSVSFKPLIPKLLLINKPKDLKHKSSSDIDKAKLKETVKKIMKNNEGKHERKKLVASEKLARKISELAKKHETSTKTTVPEIDPKKSEFLNAFQLAPRKVVTPIVGATSSTSSPSKTPSQSSSSTVTPTSQSSVTSSPQKPLRPIAPKAAIPSLKPLSAYLGAMPKRKNKEPTKNGMHNGGASNKKAKTNDLKQVLEKIIREKSNQSSMANDKKETISFNLAPFPIGSSKAENTTSSSLTTTNTTATPTKTSQSPKIDNHMPVSVANASVATAPTLPSLKGILPVSNVNGGLQMQYQQQQQQPQQTDVSNKNKNNVSPKQIVPKRALSPNATKNPLEPVFKKPMNITPTSTAKKPTPEKAKDNQKTPNKNVNAAKKGPNFPPIAPRNVPFTPPHKPSNYLNFALMNSSKNGSMPMNRTPMYSPFSPIYAPNSPQYTPNFNIQPRPTYKYTNPQAYANLMDNMYKTNELFPANNNAPKANSPKNIEPPKKSPNGEMRKSPQLSSQNKSLIPPISNPPMNQVKSISPTMKNQDNNNKKPNANSLLNKLNFPSSLSVTLTTDTDDSRTNSPSNKNHSSVNNYIEIVKLPESPTNHNTTNNTMNGNNNGIPTNIVGGKQTPSPGSISPPKTIIKIDDVKKMGENVHKDIINKVNEMCSTNGNATPNNNKSPKTTAENDNKLNKENGSNANVPPPAAAKQNGNSKETFQTKFLESILPKLSEKQNENEKTKSPKNNQKSPTSPAYSKAVQNKLGELRKISPKPPQNKVKITPPPKASPTGIPPPSQSPLHFDQRSMQQIPSPTSTPNYAYDPAKLATLFQDFAAASQNPMQNMFTGMQANQVTPFNAVPMVNLMQQAYLMEQWQKLQQMQKSAEKTYIENCLQSLKSSNNNQASSNRLE
ncbi:polycomb group protein Psc [Culicoides brevitarsis]|uniref:polycomb group protein Psc n=1 Tax=Culicoides brevitarsis TaxID=469753 RepID=UPI00307C9F69